MAYNIAIKGNPVALDATSTIIYIRTSTEEQEPLNQIKACQDINHWGEAVIIEEKQSAWKDYVERDKFYEVLQLIKKGKVSHLIVWDWDRIYRDRKKFKEFMQLCHQMKCNVHSVRQQWFEDINNIPAPWNEMVMDLMINLFGYIAEEESNKKSDRVKAAVRKHNGKTVSYKGNKWGRKPHSKQFTDSIIELYTHGKTLRQIRELSTYYDKSRNERKPSLGLVHKIIAQYRNQNSRNSENNLII